MIFHVEHAAEDLAKPEQVPLPFYQQRHIIFVFAILYKVK